jgi:hypothetical protein
MTHQLAEGDRLSLLLPEHLSTCRRNYQAVPEAPNVFQGCLASPCLAHTQRQSVSSAEVPILLPYMHPETPHDVPCPLETPVTRMAPLETWEVVGAHLVGVVSTFWPAEVASRVFLPLTVPLSLNLKGYSQPSPTSYLSCTLLLTLQPETGHISYIRSFISVSPPRPPSTGSLLTGPSVTIPGFLD